MGNDDNFDPAKLLEMRERVVELEAILDATHKDYTKAHEAYAKVQESYNHASNVFAYYARKGEAGVAEYEAEQAQYKQMRQQAGYNETAVGGLRAGQALSQRYVS